MDDFKTLAKPLPFFEPPYQSGISDPHYPLLPPPELENSKEYDQHKGLVDLQNNLAVIRANVFVRD